MDVAPFGFDRWALAMVLLDAAGVTLSIRPMSRDPLSAYQRLVAPSHVNEVGGIDLTSECSCLREPMKEGMCPCRCHESPAERVARHRRLHVTYSGWCPTCQAIKADPALRGLE